MEILRPLVRLQNASITPSTPKMRLRLRIERNALPPTQALWPVHDNKCTIAQLLEQINRTFPLEAATWGLEDYSVSVGGYDCLHYHELRAVCKDEDEVVIKPLQYIDVRSRTLNGRNQIAADGRHLVDGVPFGRPVLREPVRPDISIPPRKRRKLLGGVAEDVQGEQERPLMLTERGEEPDDDEDDQDEEDDEDFEANESLSEASSSAEDEESESSSSNGSSDEESSQSNSEDTSEDESDNPESWDGIPNSEPSTPSRKGEKSANAHPNDIRESSHHSHGRPVNNLRDLDAEQSHSTSEVTTPPFEGKSATKARNARRRDARKLAHLKSIGALPQHATLEVMRRQQQTNHGMEQGTHVKQTPSTAAPEVDALLQEHLPNGEISDVEIQQERVAENEVGDLVNIETENERSAVTKTSRKELQPAVSLGKKRKRVQEAELGVATDAEFEQKRQKLISAIASGGVDVTSGLSEDDDEPPTELSSKEQLPPIPVLDREKGPRSLPDKASAMLAPPTTPRSKLDLAGSKRLVFGSLGVRVPKTQEDRDALQKKLAGRPSKIAQADQASPETNGIIMQTNAGAHDYETGDEHEEYDAETWRDKIHLTAVECCDEGVKLSAPPFPFHQRWDSQYKKKQKGKRNGKYMESTGKKRKSGRQDEEFYETYDKYNTNGNGDALNYDDPEDEDEYWEEGALLGEQYEDDDGEGEVTEKDDGFPFLPSSVDELPTLTKDEAHSGDFITFTELACNESTEWQPKMVARTAQICSLDATPGSCIIQLSSRDLQQKVFDEEGNRVYSKFEMPDTDAEDDGRRELEWEDLGVVRLVLRPEERDVNGE